MESLTEDVLFEILARLPAKLVSQLRCMNKAMLSASSVPKFSSYQSQCNSCARCGIFLQQDNERSEWDYSVELLFLDPASSGIPKESSEKLKDAEILASGHGLVIIRKWEEEEVMYVFNPVLPQIPLMRLPSLPAPSGICTQSEIRGYKRQGYERYSLERKGIGLSFATDYYTIICLTLVVYAQCIQKGCDGVSMVECMLYDSRVKRWTSHEPRSILTGTRNLDIKNPVIANGMIHIVSSCRPCVEKSDKYYRPYIVAFQFDHPNMEEDKTEYCPVPGEALVGKEHGIEITAWGHDSLCLIRCKAKSTFMVWVTTDVRKESLWVKTHQVCLDKIVGAPRLSIIERFTVFDKRLLVFVESEEVYAINLKDGGLFKLGQHQHGFSPLHGYTNTFQQPCQGVI